jgi:hypothetical protein
MEERSEATMWSVQADVPKGRGKLRDSASSRDN